MSSTEKTISKERMAQVLRERAQLIKQSDEDIRDLGENFETLVFMLSNEKYAINSTYVSEVSEFSEITPLPCSPSFLIGIVNLRGKIFSVIDLKKFLNLKSDLDSIKGKVIFLKHNDIDIGIITDKILGNTKIYSSDLQGDITTITDLPENIIVGVTKENIIALDIEKFLMNEKLIIDEKI